MPHWPRGQQPEVLTSKHPRFLLISHLVSPLDKRERRRSENGYLVYLGAVRNLSDCLFGVGCLTNYFGKFKNQRKILSIRLAFSAAIIDITTEYCMSNGRRGRHLLEKNAECLYSVCATVSRLGRQHQMVGVGKHDLWKYRNGTSGAPFSGDLTRGSGTYHFALSIISTRPWRIISGLLMYVPGRYN